MQKVAQPETKVTFDNESLQKWQERFKQFAKLPETMTLRSMAENIADYPAKYLDLHIAVFMKEQVFPLVWNGLQLTVPLEVTVLHEKKEEKEAAIFRWFLGEIPTVTTEAVTKAAGVNALLHQLDNLIADIPRQTGSSH